MREAILRLATLYLRGEQDRERAMKRIEDCAYNPAALEALRHESDLEALLTAEGS